MPLRTKFTFHRAEKRIPMGIPVFIDGHRLAPGSESTFTENVSARGARVVSMRRWEQHEKHCKAKALPLAWSSSSRKGDG